MKLRDILFIILLLSFVNAFHYGIECNGHMSLIFYNASSILNAPTCNFKALLKGNGTLIIPNDCKDKPFRISNEEKIYTFSCPKKPITVDFPKEACANALITIKSNGEKLKLKSSNESVIIAIDNGIARTIWPKPGSVSIYVDNIYAGSMLIKNCSKTKPEFVSIIGDEFIKTNSTVKVRALSNNKPLPNLEIMVYPIKKLIITDKYGNAYFKANKEGIYWYASNITHAIIKATLVSDMANFKRGDLKGYIKFNTKICLYKECLLLNKTAYVFLPPLLIESYYVKHIITKRSTDYMVFYLLSIILLILALISLYALSFPYVYRGQVKLLGEKRVGNWIMLRFIPNVDKINIIINNMYWKTLRVDKDGRVRFILKKKGLYEIEYNDQIIFRFKVL